MFSDDNQLYKSGIISQLPQIIHSTRSCISDVKAWMTNIQLQCVYIDITEMLKPAAKMFQNCGSVPQTISLENSDVRLASCLDPAISFQKQISSVCSICYLKLHRISAVRYYLPKDVAETTAACVCSFTTRLLQLAFDGLSEVFSFQSPKAVEHCWQTHFHRIFG